MGKKVRYSKLCQLKEKKMPKVKKKLQKLKLFANHHFTSFIDKNICHAKKARTKILRNLNLIVHLKRREVFFGSENGLPLTFTIKAHRASKNYQPDFSPWNAEIFWNLTISISLVFFFPI